MDKDELVAECSRLLVKLSEASAKNIELERKLKDKISRDKNLTQQVLDTKKANQKLKNIVNDLKDNQYISAEAADILKVN